MSEESEPLLDLGQLESYIRTVDAAEKAANGDHFGAMLTLATAWDLDQPHTISALLGWMVGALQMLSMANETTIADMAAQLRAHGAR